MKSILIRILLLTLLFPSIAFGERMVPANKGSCPSGTSHAGSGYCKSRVGSSFVPATRGSCPSGTNHAGAGYCRNKRGEQYVPVRMEVARVVRHIRVLDTAGYVDPMIISRTPSTPDSNYLSDMTPDKTPQTPC